MPSSVQFSIPEINSSKFHLHGSIFIAHQFPIFDQDVWNYDRFMKSVKLVWKYVGMVGDHQPRVTITCDKESKRKKTIMIPTRSSSYWVDQNIKSLWWFVLQQSCFPHGRTTGNTIQALGLPDLTWFPENTRLDMVTLPEGDQGDYHLINQFSRLTNPIFRNTNETFSSRPNWSAGATYLRRHGERTIKCLVPLCRWRRKLASVQYRCTYQADFSQVTSSLHIHQC